MDSYCVIMTAFRPKIQRHPCWNPVELPLNHRMVPLGLETYWSWTYSLVSFLPPIPKKCAAAVSGIGVIAFFLSWTGGSRLPFELFHRVAYN